MLRQSRFFLTLPVLALTVLLLGAAIFNAPAAAQTPPRQSTPSQTELVVATRLVSPFVIRDDQGQLNGFSVDLWRALAAELGAPTRFEIYDTLPGLLDAVRTQKNAAGIAAISITAERETSLDFSHPMFRSGLSIMVRADDTQVDIKQIIFSKTTLAVLLIVAFVILIPAHVFWFIARGRDEGLPIREAYIPGIFDAMFWCAESMGGAPQGYPRRVFPRVAALLWLYVGIVLISYFTAFATTSLTMQTLRGDINSPADLAGKRVGVILGSTGADHMQRGKARVTGYPDFASAAQALHDRAVEAVVYDTPVVQYYALREGRARVAGVPFRPENYGIAFPVGSPLRRTVNQALLKLFENGAYESIHRKWLGNGQGDLQAAMKN